MSCIVAIDPGLVSLGFAYGEDKDSVTVGTVRPKKLKSAARLVYIRDSVRGILDSTSPSIVVYEGYSMGVKVGRPFDLGELGGVLKVLFLERGLDLLLVPPSNLKLFSTGKGNADKQAVSSAMEALRGEGFRYSDEADAYALFRMGLAYTEARHRPRDARHYKRTALRGCEFVGAGATGPY